MKLLVLILAICDISAFHSNNFNSKSIRTFYLSDVTTKPRSWSPNTPEVTPKSVTSEIMQHFDKSGNKNVDASFERRLLNQDVRKNTDGLHIITVLFQSARSKRLAKNFYDVPFMVDRLSSWKREWSERDISMFVYGIRSIAGLTASEGDLLRLGAKKISESKATLSSRSIGNALYGLQDITSDTDGAPSLCAALADKINAFTGDLNGLDIGNNNN
jgi:hypothetical protein